MLQTPAVVNNLSVLGNLQSTTAVGGGLTVSGGSEPVPLTVLTGAAVQGVLTTPLLECLGNLHTAGTLIASITDVVLAPSMAVTGPVTCDALSTYPFSADLYVAPGGNDGSGNGTVGNPFQTIPRALTQVEVTLGTGPKTIHLAPGTYTEDIVINSCVSIVSRTPDCDACAGTTIAGSVIVAVVRGTADVDTNIVRFKGVRVTRAMSITLAAFEIPCTFALQHCLFQFTELADTFRAVPAPGSKLLITDCHFVSTEGAINATQAFIACDWVEIEDTRFEVSLDTNESTAINGMAVVYVPGAPSVIKSFARVAVHLHFGVVTYYASTTLACLYAAAVAHLQECTFQFTYDEVVGGDAFPYVAGIITDVVDYLSLSKNTFNLQFPEGYAVTCVMPATVSTSADNILMPNSLATINNATTATLTTF